MIDVVNIELFPFFFGLAGVNFHCRLVCKILQFCRYLLHGQLMFFGLQAFDLTMGPVRKQEAHMRSCECDECGPILAELALVRRERAEASAVDVVHQGPPVTSDTLTGRVVILFQIQFELTVKLGIQSCI